VSGSNKINRVGVPEKKKEEVQTTIKPVAVSEPTNNCKGKDFLRIGNFCYYISVVDYRRANWQVRFSK